MHLGCILAIVGLIEMSIASVNIQYFVSPNTLSASFESPTLDMPSVSLPFEVSGKLGYLPTDGMEGCSISAYGPPSIGKVSVINSDGCSFSQKMEIAFDGGSVALIIQVSPSSSPGFDYKWASRDISASDNIILPTVEVSSSSGNFISQQIANGPATTIIDITSGDTNDWSGIEDGTTFLVLFRIGLSFMFFVCIVYSVVILIFGIATRKRDKISKRLMPPITVILFRKIFAYVLYLISVGSAVGIAYVAVDPLHSTGIYNQLTSGMLLVFTYLIPFFITLLYAISLLLAKTSKGQSNLVFNTIIAIGSIILFILSALNILFVLLRWYFIIDISSYFLAIQILYLVYPAVVIIFLIVVFLYLINNTDYKDADLVTLVITLGILYIIWIVSMSLGFSNNLQQIPQFVITDYGVKFAVIIAIYLSFLIYYTVNRIIEKNRSKERTLKRKINTKRATHSRYIKLNIE